MKKRPILFSAPMVRALLDGSKKQTRRICNPANDAALSFVVGPFNHEESGKEFCFGDEEGDVIFQCPYGQPGDRLWVRETFFDATSLNEGRVLYRADGMTSCFGWHPSIHMPKWASRIELEIVSVRVERLQDISEADAIAEGCPRDILYGTGWYKALWNSLNGPGSWAANPWVWVVEF